jgi:D-amino peptidase
LAEIEAVAETATAAETMAEAMAETAAGTVIETEVREAVAAVAPGAGVAAGLADEAGGPSGERTLAVRWQSASVASCLLGIPGVTAEDDRTVVVRGAMPVLYRLFGVFLRVAGSLTNQRPYC